MNSLGNQINQLWSNTLSDSQEKLAGDFRRLSSQDSSREGRNYFEDVVLQHVEKLANRYELLDGSPRGIAVDRASREVGQLLAQLQSNESTAA